MEPVAYDELLDNSLTDRPDGASGAQGPRPHAQVHLLSPTDKCKVCTEPAAKHVHYGAMTCFSCRAFFRRSIQNKTAATYVCRRSRNCEINLRTRKNCQFCRYAKCISAGMKPSWVLSEEERGRRFRKNRERGQSGPGEASPRAGAVLASHKREKGGAKGNASGFPDMEPLDESTLASLYEQQQPQALIVKKEQTLSPAPGEPSKLLVSDHRPGLVAIPSPSFEQQPQFLVKTEAGETNYIFAPVASSQQQSTILVYTAAPAESLVTSKEGLVAHPLRLPMSFITQASSGPSVTITAAPRSSAAENLAKVATIRTNHSAYENPATTNQLSSSSVIVQAPQRQVISSGYPTTNQQQNVVTKQESRNEFCPGVSNVRRSPPHVQALDQVTLSRLAAVASQEFESDSDYDKDVFSSDEEDDIRRQLISNEPEVKFCEDEAFQMEKLIKEHNDKYRSVNFGEELIKEMIMCSMFGIPVSTSAAISGYRLTVERITRIAHNLDCFTDLHKNDQATLLMENADLLVNLRGAIFFDSKNKGVNQILISMGIEDMDTIKSIYTPLMKENSMKHIDYKTFNSIQTVANAEVESRYSALQKRVAGLLSNDDIITVLTTYIILFSDDFCNLIDKRRVAQTQDRFIWMLQRYIYSQFPRKLARLKLANTLDMVTCLREMADIKKMRKINVNVKVP